MAYQTPITIKTAIDNIIKRHYVLPSIQREFVWDTDQIEMLFDSLMRDYPISTFLYWKVEKKQIKNFQFYEFLKKYHEKDCRHNKKIDLHDEDDVIALLDGQQRLTSIYLALTGSYAKKRPNFRINNPAAYPEKFLYLNLLAPSPELETEYDFQFLTEEEAAERKGYFWFKCSEILNILDMSKTAMYLMKNRLMDTSVYTENESEFAINTLNQFFNVVHQKGTISYYLEEGEELDKVLQIFIRINSGGTTLSYSDLLLSIASAQWENKDAREVIHEFVDAINNVGEGFKFNKDIVLKACLVLGDFDVKFKVDNFTKENMQQIERHWEKTSSAIKVTVELISKFGFNRDNLLSTNAIIPIAYFVYKNEAQATILHSAKHEADRKYIKEWLARVLLKGTFGGTPDSIYPGLRDAINDHHGEFPLKEIIERYRGQKKSIVFNEDDIETILNLQYGKPKTYCALTLLYPGLNLSFKYHQDHIHPQSFFSIKNLRERGFGEELIPLYQENYNSLPNLQLLQATENSEKNDKEFEEWLNEAYSNDLDRSNFLNQNFIGSDDPLSFEDFQNFFNLRRKRLKTQLMNMLCPTTSSVEIEADL